LPKKIKDKKQRYFQNCSFYSLFQISNPNIFVIFIFFIKNHFFFPRQSNFFFSKTNSRFISQIQLKCWTYFGGGRAIFSGGLGGLEGRPPSPPPNDLSLPQAKHFGDFFGVGGRRNL
jgi:hypothetical protein